MDFLFSLSFLSDSIYLDVVLCLSFREQFTGIFVIPVASSIPTLV